MTITIAPGQPGISPRWTSSAKSGVGTALGASSLLWFTISHGIVNEVYHPHIDRAAIRDLGLIVTDGSEFFSEEKRHARHEISNLAEGVPAFRLVNTCRQGRYRLEKEVFADPQRSVLLQRIRFVPLQGVLADYRLYVLLAPHLGNQGRGNTAWVGSYKGVPMLLAQRGNQALTLASSVPWCKRSAGYVGVSDGWQDLNRHKRMAWTFSRAEDGNVALTGELDLRAGEPIVLSLAFGPNPVEAGQRALDSLEADFDTMLAGYVKDWQAWQDSLQPIPSVVPDEPDLFYVSTAVLKTHESKQFPGGIIASLSIPWGSTKGDDAIGGYHLVWPRDLVETAGGLLAAGAHEEARRVLSYLEATQEADGHWLQNMWLDGTPYWRGVQMDETAFPILLVDLAWRCGAITAADVSRLWPMVHKAVAYLARNGPVTQQDRWEEDPGYSPFTLAVEIAAMLAAADLAEREGYANIATYLRQTADTWNAAIEAWIYVSGTDLAQMVGVDGYYVRIAPPDTGEAASLEEGFVPIKNRPPGESNAPAIHLVSADALALVRFGLRAANDPRVVNTVKVIDALLKVDTPFGPLWHRYNEDGYGEHEDGSPFDGTGIGRGWPLLTGERGHYELAAGNQQQAHYLLQAMTAFAGESGLLPEQVWDAGDIPQKDLYFAGPTGAAMPLVWAHAEYIKLLRSLADGQVFDMPPQPVQRYQVENRRSPYTVWRFNHKCRSMTANQTLRLELLAPASVHWSVDGWQTVRDSETTETALGVHLVDLPTERATPGTTIVFTFYWLQAKRWEGSDFTVGIISPRLNTELE